MTQKRWKISKKATVLPSRTFFNFAGNLFFLVQDKLRHLRMNVLLQLYVFCFCFFFEKKCLKPIFNFFHICMLFFFSKNSSWINMSILKEMSEQPYKPAPDYHFIWKIISGYKDIFPRHGQLPVVHWSLL